MGIMFTELSSDTNPPEDTVSWTLHKRVPEVWIVQNCYGRRPAYPEVEFRVQKKSPCV